LFYNAAPRFGFVVAFVGGIFLTGKTCGPNKCAFILMQYCHERKCKTFVLPFQFDHRQQSISKKKNRSRDTKKIRQGQMAGNTKTQ